MATRCRKCNRLKLLGRGWVSPELNVWYCPACWADICAQKIEIVQKQLQIYVDKNSSMPQELLKPTAALAQLGLACLKNVRNPDEKNFKAAETALNVFNNLGHKDTAGRVEDLLYMGFYLIKTLKMFDTLSYGLHAQITEEENLVIAAMTSLAEIDIETTLKLLEDIVTPGEAWSKSGGLKERLAPLILLDGNWHAASIIALGRIGDQRSVKTLLTLAESHFDGTILSALLDLEGQRVIMRILGMIQDDLYAFDIGENWCRVIGERISKLLGPANQIYSEIYKTWKWHKEHYQLPYAEDPTSIQFNPSGRYLLEIALLKSGRHEAVEVATEWAWSKDEKLSLEGTEVLAELDYKEALNALYNVAVAPTRDIFTRKYTEPTAWDSDDYPLNGYEPIFTSNREQRKIALRALSQRSISKAKSALAKTALDEDFVIRKFAKKLMSDLQKGFNMENNNFA